jgi:hypothetical protein
VNLRKGIKIGVGDFMEKNRFDELMDLLEIAYKNNDVNEVNRINSLIMGDLEVEVSESVLDYEFVESLRGKTVYKTLKKFIKEGDMGRSEVAKLVSSLVTHLIIESGVRSRDMKDYPIKILVDMVINLVSDEVSVSEVKRFLQNRYGRFI